MDDQVKMAAAEAKAARARAKALRPWWRRKRTWLGLGVVVVIVAVIAGSAGGSKRSDVVAPVKAASSGGSPAASAPATVAHVGATLALKTELGSSYQVQLTQVIDPAQGADQYTTPDAGNRFVAAVFRVTAGRSALSGDADTNAAVIGSDDQTYSPDLNDVAGCTNFSSGAYQIAPGESSTGCVAFQVPVGVAVRKVRWSPSAGFANDFGQWVVP